MRLTSTLAFTSLLNLVACGGGGGGSTDIEGTLSFAERTDAEIVRLINASASVELFSAINMASQFDGFDGDPCPAITFDGNVATLTGGCTRGDGLELAGSIAITNPTDFDEDIEFDYTADVVYEFDGFQIVQATDTVTVDGFVARTDGLTSYDGDLTMTQLGAALRSDVFTHCSNPNNPHCSISGSGLELVGVGGATVSGDIDIDLDGETVRQTSSFTLRGADTLEVSVDATNCVAWSISDAPDRGTTCP